MYLQYILMQPPNSLPQRVYQAQRKNPVKGDLSSETLNIANQLQIHMPNQEIQNMKRSQFKPLVKKKTSMDALKYLIEKQKAGKKGKHIKYAADLKQ